MTTGSTIVLSANKFLDNYGWDGGAIALYGAGVAASDCIIQDNEVYGGRAVYAWYSAAYNEICRNSHGGTDVHARRFAVLDNPVQQCKPRRRRATPCSSHR